ncbi:hypothetical protein AWC38_SpisGene1062 [Stylophora pistillata]|uniref:DDE Tnp4 domain-containing protein n=1 Tax=Stylophora pistillata TaxID=50429 RepID=A0A2B4SVL2_STYPI|nr:hypothetical protein AWC38_SpisGene1062 [Stylophora pistillata]
MVSGAKEKQKQIILLMMMMLDEELPVTYAKRMWAQQWLLRREETGGFHTIFQELAAEDTPGFSKYTRMLYPKCVALTELIAPYINKEDTCTRSSISASERLALTLRFLTTGESCQSLSFQFRIGKATVSGIVTEVCDAIYNVLGKDFLQTPQQAKTWSEIAELFHLRWNIPNNIGAIDGKRILIQKPAYAGSHFHDYEGNESIIALVVSGPDYECFYVDVGTNGRNQDGHAWGRCFLKKALDSPDNPLNVPPPRPLPGRVTPVPFVLTGDEAFGLAKYMLRPYPSRNLTVEQRIANYRISRAPYKVKRITLAALTLHNWLRADTSTRNIYCPPTLSDREDPETAEIIPGSWRDDIPADSFLDLQPSVSRNCSSEAKNMREEFTQWFNNEGICHGKDICADCKPIGHTKCMINPFMITSREVMNM